MGRTFELRSGKLHPLGTPSPGLASPSSAPS
jgi:hypothetical protein